MKPLTLPLLLCLAALSSCVQPAPRHYVSTMTDAQWAASERAIVRMEEQNFAMRDRELMSQARATEMATRHNPTHVTTNTTTFWLW